MSFKTHISRKEANYEKKDVLSKIQYFESDQTDTSIAEASNTCRSRRKPGSDVKLICFVCNEIKESDSESYNSGRLGSVRL